MRNEFFIKIKNGRNSIIGFLYFLFLLNIKNSFANDFIPKSSLIKLRTPLNLSLKVHAFHTSITQVEFNAKNKTFEISIRLFSDDFARAIDFENKTKNTIIQDGDKNEKAVFNYINKHFLIISAQNKKVILKFIGKENEDLATWIYIEIPAKSFVKGTKIQQNCMMELFDDQVNILNYKKGEDHKTLLFDIKNKVKIW